MAVLSDKVFDRGAFQDGEGRMVMHMHPEGEAFDGIGDQQPGEPCEWCERGVPRYGAIRRLVEGSRVTITDVETGQVLSVAEL